jgi:RsiW-degrading membrane proteinase PrsW (M82 family)
MGQRQHIRNTRVLWGLVLLAVAYASLLLYLRTLTGLPLLDGGIGVALGLYICSHPAANAVNMLFFERDALRQISEWSLIRWLALNLLVLLAGWMVIFIGITRLVGRVA